MIRRWLIWSVLFAALGLLLHAPNWIPINKVTYFSNCETFTRSFPFALVYVTRHHNLLISSHLRPGTNAPRTR